jgi:DNA-binding transcriptional regulator GbsR (MarR family)
MRTKSKPTYQFHPATIELAKAVGDFMQYWGFNKIDGQIWCLIFITQNSLSGQELAKALGLSKATVSLAIQELLFYEVIEATSRGARNTIYYRSNPDIEQVIVNVLKNRELKLIEKAAQSLTTLQETEHLNPQLAPIINHERLEELEQMIHQALAFLNILISSKLKIESNKFEPLPK